MKLHVVCLFAIFGHNHTQNAIRLLHTEDQPRETFSLRTPFTVKRKTKIVHGR